MPYLAHALCLAAAALALGAQPPSDSGDHWAQWRGPLATGEAPGAHPPVAWDETRNIRWKVALPGLGHSSPIVWNDRVFVTVHAPEGDAVEPIYSQAPGAHDNIPVTHHHRFAVVALDRATGKTLWEKTVARKLPHEGGHYTGTLASASPATDGERVYAPFGSAGLYCLDFDGNLLWQRDLGEMQTKHGHGEGSSPALYGDLLIVNWDHEGESFVAAIDKRRGTETWRVARDELTSWASPIVVEHQGRPQVVVSGTRRLRGYDLATGQLIWECGGLSSNIVASPVAGDGMVFAGSSYEIQSMVAIRLDGARGDLTDTGHVAWSRSRATPYVPSPLLYDGSLYFLRHYQGILARVDAASGAEPSGPFRLGALGDIYASPVAAAGRIYITDRDGATLVLSHADPPEALAVNQLNDRFSASAAIAGRQLFLRGEKYLYCIEE